MKVLVTDKINESAGKIIEPAAEVDFLPTMSEEELIKIEYGDNVSESSSGKEDDDELFI